MDIVSSPGQLQARDNALALQTLKDEAEIAVLLQKEKKKDVISKLSIHVDTVWEQLRKDNQSIRQKAISLFRRSRGEYEPKKLAAIRAFQGSEVFIRSGETKCRSAYSWITDIYRGANALPFSLEPSAVPTLPDETKDQIKLQIMKQGVAMQEQMAKAALAAGQPLDQATVAKAMNDWQVVAEKQAVDKIAKDAKSRCAKAETKLRDQNQEGGWDNAFKDFLWYFIRCQAGIIKGPVLTKKKRYVWEANAEGSFDFVTKETIGTDCYAVSPFNLYVAGGMKTSADGDMIEVHELTRQSLKDLDGAPGYSSEEINAVLSKLHNGELKGMWLTIEDETAVAAVEREKTASSGTPSTTSSIFTKDSQKVQALELYGSVSGFMLKEWFDNAGLDSKGIDVHAEYQANCWKIGPHVIKAVINPDELGRKPYHISSWAKSPSWILGEGLLEFAEAVEDILNSIARALQNNIAIASGPMVEVNSDRCDDKTPTYPWKKIYSTSAQMKEGPAVTYYQPQMHTTELIAAYQFFSRLLDEMTVPAYAQGASQSGVTAGTATVFTQLLAAASRSIKAVVANIDDDIITPYNQMSYDYLMKFDDDPEIKGDAHVVAKGVSGLLAKEQEAQRKVEFLQVVANPVYAQTLGAKNIGYILSEIAKANNLDLPDSERLEGNPTMEELLTKMNSQAAGVDPAQMNGQMQAGGTPANAQNTTADGRPAGAPDAQQPAQIGA